MGRLQRSVLPVVLAMVFVLGNTVGPAAAQARRGPEYVSLLGRVQWISASRMVVMTGCPFLEPCTSYSVSIDLTPTPQSDYRGIRPGDLVRVEGVVSRERGQPQVLARSVTLIDEWQAP